LDLHDELHFDDLGTVTSESREVEGAVASPGDGIEGPRLWLRVMWGYKN